MAIHYNAGSQTLNIVIIAGHVNSLIAFIMIQSDRDGRLEAFHAASASINVAMPHYSLYSRRGEL